MRETIDDRLLDEWMYTISLALESMGDDETETVTALQKTRDEMRERRTALSLRRHNETGY
ncbi:MAG: hypothetical protein NXI30_01660 [bacterium]|nr:hypothetical protein [bacterium]